MAILLTTDDTKRVITVREGIDALEGAYRALANHDAVYRQRTDMMVPLRAGEDYWLATMEGAVRTLGMAAIRLRSDRYSADRSPRKWAHRPGLYCGLVILYDIQTAEPLAIVNDGYLQVMRVGATSALAGKYLARNNSETLAVIGSGWQARGHVRAYAALFPLKQIRVFSPNAQHRQAFAEEMQQELGIPLVAMDNAKDAVHGADIVAFCTTATEQVLEGDWVEPGMYVSSLRFYREIGAQYTDRFDVYAIHSEEYTLPSYRAGSPEDWTSSSGIYHLYEHDVRAPNAIPLHHIIGGIAPGRTDGRQRTVFNNHGGLGIQFAALGRIVYDRAREQGLGHDLPAEWFLQDITT